MIRLSLFLLAGLFAAMLVWGTDSVELQVEPIAEMVLEDGSPSNVAVSAPEPVARIVAVIEPTVKLADWTKPDALDQTPSVATSDLIVVQSSDAPADAAVIEATNGQPEAVTPIEVVKVLVVTGNSVNMRAGPSTNLGIVGNLKRGDRAELVAEAVNGWVEIRSVESGRVGFMAARFLEPEPL